MPTTHVEPGSQDLLQEIATTLWKSRKVVVITGAGISTNSGIPDFRSENGLYSLIQAQFDAAASRDDARSNEDADESDVASEPERHAKRRKIAREESLAVFPKLFRSAPRSNEPPTQIVSEEAQEVKLDTIEVAPGSPQKDASTSQKKAGPREEPRVEDEIVVGVSEEREQGPRLPSIPPTADLDECVAGSSQTARGVARTPLLSPRPSSGTSGPVEMDIDQFTSGPTIHVISSPPSLSLGPPIDSTDHEPPRTVLSSPLSSPPPYLSDPFQEYSQQSSSPLPQSPSQDDSSSSQSSQSHSSSSASTPLLTSQTSFASSASRTSLPNLKGKDLFDAQIWSCPTKTSVFYTFATTLRQKVRTAEPTNSHRFVSVLRDARKLVRCYTQNIDQLEERVGLATSLALGAGTRYRFSTRAGRNSGGSKVPTKDTETPDQKDTPSDSHPASRPSESDATEPSTKDVPIGDPETLDSNPTDVDGGTNEGSSSQDSTSGANESSGNGPPTDGPPPPGPNRGVECVCLHGSLAELRCFACGRTSTWDDEERLADTMAGRQPTCPHCAGATAARQERGKRALGVGKLRPDIVLYGEEHPHAHLISPIIQHDLSLGPDMLLILGTSMRVHGLKVLVREFAKAVHDRGGKVVFVNFTKPPDSVWSDVIDYWVQWDCDAWVGDLRERKPALFLPPGTVLETEKSKPAKTSRKSGGPEGAKQRDSGQAPPGEKKIGRRPKKPPPTESDEILVGGSEQPSSPNNTQLVEVKAPASRPLRPPRARREPRYNPDAKRPAAVRDDRFNGAYLVRKIGFELRRITGAATTEDIPTSQPAARAKTRVKRARKSAPAVLESQTSAVPQSEESPATIVELPGLRPQPSFQQLPRFPPQGFFHQLPAPAPQVSLQSLPGPAPQASLQPPPGPTPQVSLQQLPSPAPKVEMQPPSTHSVDQDDSISAAVKNRKRKRTVTWKKIHGVETPVALEDEVKPPILPPPPPTALPGPASLLSLSQQAPSLEMPPVKLPKLMMHADTSPRPKPKPLEPAPTPFQNPFFFSDPLWKHFAYPCSPTAQLRREEQEAVTALSSMSGRF
ncbi:hypothetical protein QBC47DRAFT_409808 [Echria macrotheca]|uniref:Deacetylase sirtuin-type domain-containing protein n=1 Tax=Echria macrotheca TaxID=438768 RepID=A0AAJ0F9E9_9PEZI|nr:hypothetical protein QBC47DRAFT_409808 [Echria macrotheca]